MSEVLFPRILTVPEAAKILRVSPPTVRTLISTGKLSALTFSTEDGKRGSVRVTEADLKEFIHLHRTDGGGR